MARARIFLLVEAASFVTAALVHLGVLFHGYHRKAGTAESVIAAVLLAGLALTWIRPVWARGAALAAQAVALLGTLVGLFTIAVGIGPRTAPDLTYHAAIVAVLVWGLLAVGRSAGPPRDARTTSR